MIACVYIVLLRFISSCLFELQQMELFKIVWFFFERVKLHNSEIVCRFASFGPKGYHILTYVFGRCVDTDECGQVGGKGSADCAFCNI